MGELSRSSRKPSTLAFYDALLRTHLLPAFGKRPLRSVTREDVASFFESLLETNMGINSVRNVTGLLCRIMKAAVSGNTLACNPCDGMAQPKRETIPVSALRLREQRKLEGEAVRDRDGLAVLLALYTGMRIGEICALKWEDVDLAAGLVYVRRTLQRVRAENGPRKTETVFGSPKSVRSRRSIPLASSLIEFLKEAECERTGEYVISRGKGFAEPRAVRYRFGRILRKAGIPHMRFHVLRHTFATRCMETGANITTLSRLLGHASVKMTLDVYTDATPECKAAAVNGLDKLGLRRRAA
jgi:integrase